MLSPFLFILVSFLLFFLFVNLLCLIFSQQVRELSSHVVSCFAMSNMDRFYAVASNKLPSTAVLDAAIANESIRNEMIAKEETVNVVCVRTLLWSYVLLCL